MLEDTMAHEREGERAGMRRTERGALLGLALIISVIGAFPEATETARISGSA